MQKRFSVQLPGVAKFGLTACFLAAIGFSSPAMSQDALTATVQNGAETGFTTQPLSLSAPLPIAGPFVSLSTSGIGSEPLRVHNWALATQLPHFFAAVAAGTAKIVALGDSITRGFGSAAAGWTQTSFPVELAQFLTQDGVPAQSDNFLGDGGFYVSGTDLRIALIGGAAWDGNIVDAGGPALQTVNQGDGFDFTLNWPGNYDRVTISYIDSGSGAATVAVDGAPVATLAAGNSGNTLTQTVNLPPGLHSKLSLRQSGDAATFVQGASFWSTTHPAIQVQNAGIGGWSAVAANMSVCNGNLVAGSGCGFGQTAGVAALAPNLVIIDLGVNDMLQNIPASTTVASIDAMVTTLQSAGVDVMLMVPQPTNAPACIAGMPTLRSALRALADRRNLPLVDLWKTYRSFAELSAAGLMGSDSIHPDSTLYADIAARLALRLRGS